MFTLYEADVVPHEGTWIEMNLCTHKKTVLIVVPHEGTWIEIEVEKIEDTARQGRSPRGNVD